MSEEIKKEELHGEEELIEKEIDDLDTDKVSGGYSGPLFTYDLAKDKKNS